MRFGQLAAVPILAPKREAFEFREATILIVAR
jgi:hypothetical protein